MDGIPKPYPRSIIESMRFMMCFPSVPWMLSIRRMILVNLLFTEIMRFLRRFKFYHMKTCKHIFQNTKRKPQMKFNHINIIYIYIICLYIYFHISHIIYSNIYIYIRSNIQVCISLFPDLLGLFATRKNLSSFLAGQPTVPPGHQQSL